MFKIVLSGGIKADHIIPNKEKNFVLVNSIDRSPTLRFHITAGASSKAEEKVQQGLWIPLVSNIY